MRGLLDPITEYLEERRSGERLERVVLPDVTEAEPPASHPILARRELRRGLKPSETGASTRSPISLEAARALIDAKIAAYLAIPNPTHALVIAAVPGVGKTYRGVAAAEKLAAEGKHVLYAGPRHPFFQDVIDVSTNMRDAAGNLIGHPDWWFEWQPRQGGEAVVQAGKVETCIHADDIATWQSRGHKSNEFCRRVCGWKYYQEQCVYTAQGRQVLARGKRMGVPMIVFGQHQHVWGGHPLTFDVLIGDEAPFSAFLHLWRIPAKHICPPGMDIRDPLTELLHDLTRLAESGGRFEGVELFKYLGGPARVLEAVEHLAAAPEDAGDVPPPISYASEAEAVPFGHLRKLCKMLAREAERHAQELPFIPRVCLAGGELLLNMRHRVNEKMPAHIIWLDATADKHLYEAVLGREVELVAPDTAFHPTVSVYQVWDRANGKGSLEVGTGDDRQLHKEHAAQLKAQVNQILRYGYDAPAVITFERLKPLFSEEGSPIQAAHFYGSRGANNMAKADCLIVAGTPQPQGTELVIMAKMLFYDRDEPFDASWEVEERPYIGHPFSNQVSGFWRDDDLKSLLWQFRDAELIQAAHRARLVLGDRPGGLLHVWFLFNLPIDALPPTELLSVRELFGAPRDVDPYIWPRVQEAARAAIERNGFVTTVDLVRELEVSKMAAGKYIDRLIAESQAADPEGRSPDTLIDLKGAMPRGGGRGRPPKAAAPRSALPE